jgi:antitoxin component YwqK of YwqJK toxin-antitoxin module
MALINCPECQKKISDSSKKCIGCGFPLDQKKSKSGKSGSNSWKKIAFMLSTGIIITVGVLLYRSGIIIDSRDPYSLENIKVNEIDQLFLDFQSALKKQESLEDKKAVYNDYPEFQELFQYSLNGAFNNEDEWIQFISKTPFASPNLVFSTISLSDETLLKKRYDLFLSGKILSRKTSFQDFYSADEEQQTALFNSGKEANIYSAKYDLATFQEAWSKTPQLVQDCINVYSEHYLNNELVKAYKFLVLEGLDLGNELEFINKIKDDQEREDLLYLISDSDNNTELKKICDLLNISFSSIPLDDINTIKDITNKKAFDLNGNLMGLLSESGLWTGHWKEYYSNNVLAIEGNYKGGLMNGKFKCYLRDGTLCHEGSFKNGIRNERNSYGYLTSGRIGLHNFYHLNGKIMCRKNVTSENFKNCNVQYWHSNGVKGGEVKFSSFRKERDREIEWIDDYGRWKSRYTYKNSLVYFDYSVTYWNTNGLQESIVTKWRQKRSDMDEELIEKGFLKY